MTSVVSSIADLREKGTSITSSNDHPWVNAAGQRGSREIGMAQRQLSVVHFVTSHSLIDIGVLKFFRERWPQSLCGSPDNEFCIQDQVLRWQDLVGFDILDQDFCRSSSRFLQGSTDVQLS